MKVSGILKVKMETQQVSDKFKKREFVLTIDPTTPYPQHVLMQLTQDKCSLIDQYATGQELSVEINLRGREHLNKDGETKYYNTIEVWKVEKHINQ